MKTTKGPKITAALLTVLMILAMMPAMASAEEPGQIGDAGATRYFDDKGKPSDAESFTVAVTKSISDTDTASGLRLPENEFEISLEVQTTATRTDIEQAADAAVVILIDISLSMSDEDLKAAREAALKFIEKFTENARTAKRYVSVVSFGLDASVIGWSKGNYYNNNSWADVNTASGMAAAKYWVNGLTTKSAGTFMQGAFILARNLYNMVNFTGTIQAGLSGVPAKNRFVVMLTDGDPNAYNGDPNAYYGGSESTVDNTTTALATLRGTGAAQSNAAIQRGRKHTSGDGTASYPHESSIAYQVKNMATVYTIAYNIDPKRTWDTTQNAEQWLAANIASSPANALTSAQGQAGLELAFDKIKESIDYAVNPWQVVDPMSRGVAFNGTTIPNIVAINGGTLTWNLQKAAPIGPGVTTTAGNVTRTVFTYKYAYRMKIDNLNYNFSDYTDTNDVTELSYRMGEDPEVYTVGFGVPKVKAFDAAFAFVKKDSAGDVVRGAAFTLYLGGAEYMTVASGENGLVDFGRLPSGHAYTLKETSAPAGLIQDENDYTVTVSYGELAITGGEGHSAFSADHSLFTNQIEGVTGIRVEKEIVSVTPMTPAYKEKPLFPHGSDVTFKVTITNGGNVAATAPLTDILTSADNTGFLSPDITFYTYREGAIVPVCGVDSITVPAKGVMVVFYNIVAEGQADASRAAEIGAAALAVKGAYEAYQQALDDARAAASDTEGTISDRQEAVDAAELALHIAKTELEAAQGAFEKLIDAKDILADDEDPDLGVIKAAEAALARLAESGKAPDVYEYANHAAFGDYGYDSKEFAVNYEKMPFLTLKKEVRVNGGPLSKFEAAKPGDLVEFVITVANIGDEASGPMALIDEFEGLSYEFEIPSLEAGASYPITLSSEACDWSGILVNTSYTTVNLLTNTAILGEYVDGAFEPVRESSASVVIRNKTAIMVTLDIDKKAALAGTAANPAEIPESEWKESITLTNNASVKVFYRVTVTKGGNVGYAVNGTIRDMLNEKEFGLTEEQANFMIGANETVWTVYLSATLPGVGTYKNVASITEAWFAEENDDDTIVVTLIVDPDSPEAKVTILGPVSNGDYTTYNSSNQAASPDPTPTAIPDAPVPAAQPPAADIPEEEEYIVIEEEDLPLGKLPQTGDAAHIGVCITGLLVALFALGGADASLMKKEED